MTTALSHVSEKPWSDYTKADYTPEQWHTACLVHIHQGTPTSKDQCKVPVRTPNGAINRNGVHAAAAALAGARGGVNASPEQLNSAKTTLRRLYSELGEEPPPSMKHSNSTEFVGDFISHFGKRGMKWGHRKDKGNSALTEHNSSEDARTAHEITKKVATGGTKSLSNKELRHLVDRIKLEAQFQEVTSGVARKQNPYKAGANYVAKKIGKTGDMAVNAILNTAVQIKVQEEFQKKLKK